MNTAVTGYPRPIGGCFGDKGRCWIPYAGKGDGLTSHLRVRFAQCDYVGIELEVNQGIVFAAGRRWIALRRMLIDSLRTGCAALSAP